MMVLVKGLLELGWNELERVGTRFSRSTLREVSSHRVPRVFHA
jgi:hypothetical protein